MARDLTVRVSVTANGLTKAMNKTARALVGLYVATLRCKLSDLLQRRGWPRRLAILISRLLPVWSLLKLWARLCDKREWPYG